MIELINAAKEFKTKNYDTRALDNVNLTFGRTGFVCVLGPSGCGKTTLLNVLGGLDKLSGGSLVINGKNTAEFSENDWNVHRSGGVGFVFQQCCLIPHLSLQKNVELPLSVAGEKTDKERRALKALKAVGLDGIAGKLPNEVSGGQMQRAAIARAIVNNPAAVLADEPTGALDSASGEAVADILKSISRTRLVIMVTHNRELAKRYATRIIEMHDGRIISDSGEQGGEADCTTERTSAKMGIGATLALSAGNLWAKKFRTSLMSAVGSIGIIGVCIVIALTSWFSSFVTGVESQLLFTYGIITGSAMDVSAIVSALLGQSSGADIDYSDPNDVYVHNLLTGFYNNYTSHIEFSPEYAKYINAMPSDYYRYIKSDYEISFKNNVFTTIDINNVELNTSLDYVISQATGYSDIVNTALQMFTYFSQLPDNKAAVSERYELVYGSYPESKEQLVFVLNEDDTISDYVLALLGYYSFSDIISFFSGKIDGLKYSWSYEELTNKKFTYFNNDIVYEAKNGSYTQIRAYSKSVRPLTANEDEGLELNITGVLRSKSSGSGLMSGLYYTTDFTDYVLASSKQSGIVKQMKADAAAGKILNPLNNNAPMIEAQWKQLLRYLGGNDIPSYMEIFASNVEVKQKIFAYLDKWNADNPDEYVRYVDNVNVVTSLLGETMSCATLILLILTGISMLITAVMSAVVSYMSVKERIKEIGLLRSIGARRSDIARMIFAESSFIGLIAGVLGVAFSYAAIAVFGLFSPAAGVTVAVLPWWASLLCIAANVLLNIIFGLFPAIKAARQDPVTALRTE